MRREEAEKGPVSTDGAWSWGGSWLGPGGDGLASDCPLRVAISPQPAGVVLVVPDGFSS